jgi:hypothetical protein
MDDFTDRTRATQRNAWQAIEALRWLARDGLLDMLTDDEAAHLLVAADDVREAIIAVHGRDKPAKWAKEMRARSEALAGIAASLEPAKPAAPRPTDPDATDITRELTSEGVATTGEPTPAA